MKEHNKLSIRPPVILVHGMWGDQNTLNEVGDVFIKQGYSVDSICLPGHRKISEYTQQRKKQLGETSWISCHWPCIPRKHGDEPQLLNSAWP